MHNRFKTEAGCSPSWEDKIRERGSEVDQCCQISALPRQAAFRPQPLLFCPLLSLSIQQSVGTASFNFNNFKGENIKELESEQGSQWSDRTFTDSF